MSYVAHSQVLFSGTAGATGNTQSTPKVCRYSKEGVFFLDVTAASGSSPTLDVTIHTYDEVGGNWHLLGTFDRMTATGTDVGYIASGLGEKLSVTYTIGGTTPSFTFKVAVNLKDIL